MPPPETETWMSSFSAVLPAMKMGSSIFMRASLGSQMSMGTRLMRTLPVPLTAEARATAVLRLPEVFTTFFAILGLLLHAEGDGGAAEPGGELGDREVRLGLAPGAVGDDGLRAGQLLGDAQVRLDALVGGAAGGRLVVDHAAAGALDQQVRLAREERALAVRAHLALEQVVLLDGLLARADHDGLLGVDDVDLVALDGALGGVRGHAAQHAAGGVDDGDAALGVGFQRVLGVVVFGSGHVVHPMMRQFWPFGKALTASCRLSTLPPALATLALAEALAL